MAGSYGGCIFNFLRSCQSCFPKWLCHFTGVYEDSSCSTSLPTFICLKKIFFTKNFLNYSHPVGGKWYIILVLIWISLMTNEHLFMYLIYHLNIFFDEVYIWIFCPFFKNWDFLLLNFWELVIYAEYKSFTRYVICK